MTPRCTTVRWAVHAMMLAEVLGLITGSATAPELFVAPGGDDARTGTRDQPFATIHRAQEAARAARQARPGEAVTVTLRGGQYQLDRPLVFSAADSGASLDAPVRYRAGDGEEVVLSGGRTITPWQPDPDRPGVWKTRVADPDQEEGSAWRFEQLWVNQQRAVRARTPIYWQFHQVAGDVVEQELADQPGRFQHTFPVRPEQLAPLANLHETELRKDRFTAEKFDADVITDLALAAEMRYVNITTRHHDSFCLFATPLPTKPQPADPLLKRT
ncbi:MAG: hypothetical protein FJ276_23925 [Planctomycetes bacterium]|nr:hypothetical protein [Planctomycetota bacterium]